MQSASRSTGIPILWLAASLVLVPASARAQDTFSSEPAISPDGKRLVNIINALRGRRGRPGSAESYDYIGQWIFRIELGEEKPDPQLLHRETGAKVSQSGHLFTDAVILDDGAVIAFKDTGEITRWGPSGDQVTSRLFDKESLFLNVHLRPDGKELLVFRQFNDSPAAEKILQEVYSIDIASNKAELRSAFKDLLDHEVHWSPDLKHLIAAETANQSTGSGAGNEDREGNESYRLVRIDLETGDREVISTTVWFYGNLVGRKWIAWNHKEGNRKGIFWMVPAAGPYEPKEVPSLKDWTPIALIDDERFLCRSIDWRRHAMADFSASPEGPGKQGPAIKELKLPKYLSDQNIFWSPALEAILLCPRAFTWELRGLDGKLRRTVRFDPRARVTQEK